MMQATNATAPSNHRVLVVEDDPSRASELTSRLEYLNFDATVIAAQAVDDVTIASEWQAVMVGQVDASNALAGMFKRIAARQENLPFLYPSGNQQLKALVDACNPGHAWSFEAPLRRSQLQTLLKRAVRYNNMPDDRRRRITGVSASVKAVRAAIEQVAEHDTNVLIGGESGTGKELVARAIHDLSDRSERPFVPLNCGAVQAELLESELFGHDRGAFTGAVTDRKGRLELAANGTLFLDEIGDMSMPMQVKLLRVLQEREYRTVGGARSLKLNCRIVAATHRDLDKAVQDGTFRRDLYYRLNVFPIYMPSLRKRVDDIPLLLEELMISTNSEGKSQQRLTQGALDALANYPWPGNVRELSNLVERLAILNPTGKIDFDDLPEKYRLVGYTPQLTQNQRPSFDEFANANNHLGDGVDLRDVLIGVEIRMIRQAMDQAGGTVAKAARLLKLQRTTLVEKLKKYRLNSDDSSDF